MNLSHSAGLSWLAPSTWSKRAIVLFACLLVIDAIKHLCILPVNPPPPQVDALEYWELSGATLEGDWWWTKPNISYRTPIYPAYLAIWRATCGKFAIQGAIAGQHIMVMLTSLLTAAICGQFCRSVAASLLAYALSILCYSRDWYANVLYTETLFTLEMTVTVALMLAYHRQPTPRRAVWIGASLAIATLTRPITCYLWFVVAAFFLARPIFQREVKRPALIHTAAMAVCFYAILSPWYVRNALMFGEPFLVKFTGRNIWVVTFFGESGAGATLANGKASQEFKQRMATQPPVPITETFGVSRALTRSGLADDDVDRLMVRVCFEALSQDWKRVAYRTFRRTVNYWRCISNPLPADDWGGDPAEYLGQSVWKSERLTNWYKQWNRIALSRSLRGNELITLLVLLGLASLVLQRSSRALGIGMAGILIYFNLVTAIVEIPTFRYRMILEPALIIVGVCGLLTSWYQFYPPRPNPK